MNFVSVLSDSPALGHAITVSGKATYNAERFSVSLTSGKAPNSDVAMMIAVDFSQNKIQRSACVNGTWSECEGSEHCTGDPSNPIKRGESFKIYILVGDDRFNVSIDDEQFCSFAFKFPVKNIKAIVVNGDLEAVTQADQRKVFPVVYPIVSSDFDDIVFSGFIPRKYSPGNVVVLTGVPSANPSGEFVIMFNEDDCRRQLIHFNVRFDEQSVIINTMHDDDE